MYDNRYSHKNRITMKILLSLFCIVSFCLTAFAQDEMPKELQELSKDYLHQLPGRKWASYYLIPPPSYHDDSVYPLIISLHGAGEKGDRMVRYWKEAAAKRNMFLVCPNSTVYAWDQENAINILHCIDKVIKDFSVNQEKILLSGISAGGTLTYALGLAGKGEFPYLNPMSTMLQEQFLAQLKPENHAKIYITHGANDENVSPEYGEQAAKKLSEKGLDVTFVLRPNDGHEVPEGEQEAILNWFVPTIQMHTPPPIPKQ
jgi:phospholipase/carboxylesterase